MTESNETPNTLEEGDESKHRRIKSFVMRAGRMTEGQQKGLEQGTPLFVLPLVDTPVDYDQVFGRSAPRSLEIGFGMGHSLLEMAAASPEQDFIGVEVHRPGVGALLNGVLTQGLTNLRVYDCDAIEVLNRCIADNSLDRLMLFFPDPWHKSRQGHGHITGGGLLDNIPRVLPKGAQAIVDVASWQRPAVFDWLQEKGNVNETEMHRVLNCGVGMVICVAQEHVETALNVLREAGEQPWVIGQIATAPEGAAQVELKNLKAH